MHVFRAFVCLQLAYLPYCQNPSPLLQSYLSVGHTHPQPLWKAPKTTKVERNPRHRKSTPHGTFQARHCLYRSSLNKRSFRDALGTFFKPTKTDDPLADFYMAYRREVSEYDVEYVKKYSEDLDTTLIFVHCLLCAPFNNLTCLVGWIVLCS